MESSDVPLNMLIHPSKASCGRLNSICNNISLKIGICNTCNHQNKGRNRLDVQHDMSVALSETNPQCDVLIQAKQEQCSHSYIKKKKN
jgi:hypothetical protein